MNNNNSTSLIRIKSFSIWVPIIILALAIGFELLFILILNDGLLIYTLDDAYIHLTLSENIWQGHYGINLEEISSSSSSIIWPFILAPFSVFSERVYSYVPLVINILAAIATVFLFAQISCIAYSRYKNPKRDSTIGAVVLLLMVATNLIGLIFTGMEHSFQVFLITAVVLGLINKVKTQKISWWLYVAIIVGPLVRYENLAVSLPALLFLALRGHFVISFLTGGILALLVGGFSLFLLSLNLEIFPMSVMLKAKVGSVEAILDKFSVNFSSREGVILSLGILLAVFIALSAKRTVEERLLAVCVAFSILLHLFFGKFGWYHRYDMYIWTFSLLMLIYFYGDTLLRVLTEHVAFPVLILFAIIVITSLGSIMAVFSTPIAANNIYEQNYQMHRFVTEYYKAPVAVNDLGLVAYKNENYVLDLMGLASMEVLQARRQSIPDPLWMNLLAQKRNVKMAMLFEKWFLELPDNWIPIGDLYLGNRRVTSAVDRVTFYTLDPEAFNRVKSLIEDFRKTLPGGVVFNFR